MKAIVLIVVEPNKLDHVCKELSKIEEVVKVYEITGEFDVFIEVDMEDVQSFRRLLKDKIMKISGVRMTQSSIVIGEWK